MRPVVTEFSVLLPVYIGDNADFFRRALRSVGADQTLPPSQIVVVCDGPVPADIDRFLDEAVAGLRDEVTGGVPLSVVRLEENSGLSHALNVGIRHCAHEIIVRADADDISLPQRFAEQIPLIERGYDLVGSAIAEFETDESRPGMVRRMPLTPEDIRATIDYRDPFNHPTVIYRRSAVEGVGGYEHVNHMEDYWLFARMVAAGVRSCNHPDALVLYRVGAGAYTRRGGWTMLRSELDLQRRMASLGLVSPLKSVRNVVVRGGYRLIPAGVRQMLYRAVGAKRWFASSRAQRDESSSEHE